MTSRYDIAAIKKQLAAAEKHDKEIYGEKVRKMLLEKTNLDSLKDVLHDYDIVVVPKPNMRLKRRPTNKQPKMIQPTWPANGQKMQQTMTMNGAMMMNSLICY